MISSNTCWSVASTPGCFRSLKHRFEVAGAAAWIGAEGWVRQRFRLEASDEIPQGLDEKMAPRSSGCAASCGMLGATAGVTPVYPGDRRNSSTVGGTPPPSRASRSVATFSQHHAAILE